MPLITIVVPIHNEATYLDELLPDLVGEVIAATGSPQQLLLVENGSSDTTLAMATDWTERLGTAGWKANVLSLPDPDYGAAMFAGFSRADGDWVVNFDIDYFSGDFLTHLTGTNADVVIASKRDPQSEDRRSYMRRAGTYGFNLMLRTVVNSQVSDTHGIKAFKRDCLEAMLESVGSRNDLFDTELVLRCERAGYSIIEVPVVVEERRAARTPFLRRVPRTVKGLFQLRSTFATERRNTTSR